MEYNYSERMAKLNGAATREILKLLTRPEIISFAGGFPATQCLPQKEVQEIAHELLSEGRATDVLQYGTTPQSTPYRCCACWRHRPLPSAAHTVPLPPPVPR